MTPSDKDAANEVRDAKAKLEALFGGSSSPSPTAGGRSFSTQSAAPSGRVFANARKSTGRAPTEYRLRLERLRTAREDEEVKQAIDTFLAHHQLPDEVDVLYKVLQHPDEKVIRDALGQLSSLLMQGRLTATMLLKDHLNSLRAKAKEPATLSYIDGLTSQLDSL